MTGFLRRLAGRALGTDPEVHSVGATPFVDAPFSAEPEAAAPLSSSEAAEQATPTRGELAPVGAPESLERALAPRWTAQPDGAPQRPTAEPIVASRTRRIGPPVRAAPLSGRRFVPLVPQSEHDRSDMYAIRQPAAPHAEQVSGRLPVPSRPERTAAPVIRSGRAVHQPLRHGKVSSPTEVHVHIGRIEVTAVNPAAAAPRRAPPPRPKPTSLSTYLDQHSGKGR